MHNLVARALRVWNFSLANQLSRGANSSGTAATSTANMALQLKKILITDEVDPKCVDILRENGLEVVQNTSLAKNKNQLIAEIKEYDGLIVRSATKVTADVINAADKLKIIGRAGTGVDNIDCDAATNKGVVVMNTPGGNTLSAAELTCTLLLAMSRHISQGTESLKAGRWDRKKFMGNEVSGKTLAIIGLGRIGEKVAERMQSFGMTTIGFDPIIPGEVSAEFGVKWMPMEDLWPVADYITVHTPLIPQTKHMINDDVFSRCKRGVRVINCARGGIIDEDALLRALESGQCGGAGLDVFVEEPPTNTALIQHPLVTSTPHLGASTVEAQSRVAEEIAQQFVDSRDGKSLFGAINARALSDALNPSTKPWVELGNALGKIIQASTSNTSAVSIETQGSGLQKASGYLSAALYTGLLSTKSTNGLNLVSAPALAKQLGHQITVSHVAGDCDQLTVSVCGVSLSGSVAAGTPVLTSIGENKLIQGAALTGSLLLYNAACGKQILSDITGAVESAGSGLASYISSVGGDSYWAVCHLTAPIANTDSIKPLVNSVYTVNI